MTKQGSQQQYIGEERAPEAKKTVAIAIYCSSGTRNSRDAGISYQGRQKQQGRQQQQGRSISRDISSSRDASISRNASSNIDASSSQGRQQEQGCQQQG
jgi:hypothetical protein